MHKMVFLRSFSSSIPKWIPADNFEDCQSHFTNLTGIPCDCVQFYYNGKKLDDPQYHLGSNGTVDIVLGLDGGKGGFGSMLRALGAQIEKTTNREACRDLSGRRLRDINEEDRLKKYVSKKADREKEKQEAKEAKLKKLRKLVTKGETKHEFKDKKYDQAREAATDRVHEAINQVFNDKPSTSGSNGKPPAEPGVKRKADSDAKTGPSRAKKGLWIGVDLDDSDLDSSSDEEDGKK